MAVVGGGVPRATGDMGVRGRSQLRVALVAMLAVALASCQADRAPADKWKVIRVCDRASWTVPAENAREIKKGAEKDCGIFPAKPHPKRGKFGGLEL